MNCASKERGAQLTMGSSLFAHAYGSMHMTVAANIAFSSLEDENNVMQDLLLASFIAIRLWWRKFFFSFHYINVHYHSLLK